MFDLVQKLRNCTFKQSLRYLSGLTGINPYNVLTNDYEAAERPLRALQRHCGARMKKGPETQPVLTSIAENVLTYFDDRTFYTGWRDEGIDAAVMRKFGIRWNESTQAIIIPHFDKEGKLIGIRRRLTHDGMHNKYMPLTLASKTYAHPLGVNLYGLYEHKEAIQRSRQAIIFEGEKSVLKHHTFYGDKSNAVAVCGFSVTPYQRDLLIALGIEEVILGFDKDVFMSGDSIYTEEYRRYCESINRMGRMFTPYCKVFAIVDYDNKLQLKDSPVDKGQEVFEYLIQHKEMILN